MEKTIRPQHTQRERLNQLLCKIPHGKVATYAELARVLGTSPRAVASMLASNREPNAYPCYKVVASDGKMSGYNLGTDEKLRRLTADGVEVSDGKVSKDRFFVFER